MSFYFIFLECTSAVSSDVEGRMYEHAKSLGITLITISIRCVLSLPLRTGYLTSRYRPSLMKYHTHLLTLKGDGSAGWTLSRVGTAEEMMGTNREIASLEEKLADVEKWEERVRELDRMLAVQVPVDEDEKSV